MRVLAIISAALLGLAACSTASDHTQHIAAFAEAIDASEKSLGLFSTGGADRLSTIRRERVLQGSSRLEDRGNCTTSLDSKEDCQLFVISSPRDPNAVPLRVTSLIPEHLAAAHSIKLYAAALREIAEADRTAGVKAAVDKAAAATTALATLAPAGTAVIVPFIVPTGKLIVWAYGRYQEEVKLDALKHATAEMDPVMRDASAKFAKAATYFQLPDLARLVADRDTKLAAYEGARTDANLRALEESTDKLNAARRADPARLFLSIGATHSELARSLTSSDELSFANFFVMAERLKKDAEELYKIAEEFRDAAKKAGA